MKRLTKTLLTADPPVDAVLVAGDFFDSLRRASRIDIAAGMINRLVRHGIDVVLVDGNHDSAIRIHTGSPTMFLHEFGAGVHLVNDTAYKIIRDDEWQNPRLRGRLAVHCMPYRAVVAGQYTGVLPLSGLRNVLLAHGRVGGMPEQNSMELSVARIRPELLRRAWDYVALGDWHVHRYQPLSDVHAYYAGSLEALNFREACSFPPRKDDLNALHGAVDVTLVEGGQLRVDTIPHEARPVLRLKAIDAHDMNAAALMDELVKRLDAGIPVEALVLLEVKNCPRESWEQLDHPRLQSLREKLRRCEIRPEFLRPEIAESAQAASEATLNEQWQQFLADNVKDESERAWLLTEGMAGIEHSRQKLQGQRAAAGEE